MCLAFRFILYSVWHISLTTYTPCIIRFVYISNFILPGSYMVCFQLLRSQLLRKKRFLVGEKMFFVNISSEFDN